MAEMEIPAHQFTGGLEKYYADTREVMVGISLAHWAHSVCPAFNL